MFIVNVWFGASEAEVSERFAEYSAARDFACYYCDRLDVSMISIAEVCDGVTVWYWSDVSEG